ncbi:hypothetical protein [Endozoicomonas sp. Mp262]|uniref:hypothetical protein n=1 Tax=Endozoicomonas sp. Mp262 TaxID=2919499 RepID=UPI0021D9B1CC
MNINNFNQIQRLLQSGAYKINESTKAIQTNDGYSVICNGSKIEIYNTFNKLPPAAKKLATKTLSQFNITKSKIQLDSMDKPPLMHKKNDPVLKTNATQSHGKAVNETAKRKIPVKANNPYLVNINPSLYSKFKDMVDRIRPMDTEGADKLIERFNGISTQRELVNLIDDARDELSRIAGKRLTDQNPNIADLSDPNRPTKLAEQLSSLYDDEWTDAYEELEKAGYSEKAGIDLLMRSLYSLEKLAALHMDSDSRSQSEAANVNHVLNMHRQHPDNKHSGKHLEAYLRQACTIMVRAKKLRPAVVLMPEAHKGAAVDKNYYRIYTSSGSTVDYQVWPALLLHKNGPLLSKGIVQGYSRPVSIKKPVKATPAQKHVLTLDRQLQNIVIKVLQDDRITLEHVRFWLKNQEAGILRFLQKNIERYTAGFSGYKANMLKWLVNRSVVNDVQPHAGNDPHEMARFQKVRH